MQIAPLPPAPDLAALTAGASLEVTPRTAEKIADFRALLPPGRRIYIAHIAGTDFAAMLATAKRLTGEGYEVMPHIPARVIPSRAALEDWLARYQGEAGVKSALILGGGLARPEGPFESSQALLETGLFDGFTRLHVAGHPEGSRDLDPGGGEAVALAALRWKADYARQSGKAMAIVTQFAFEAGPILDWAGRLAAEGIDLPIHLGIAGPAKLQTLLKYAITCGVGPSLRVLQKRARDVRKLLLPYKPDALLADLATARGAAFRAGAHFPIEQLHFFPLGGIEASAAYLADLNLEGAPAP